MIAFCPQAPRRAFVASVIAPLIVALTSCTPVTAARAPSAEPSPPGTRPALEYAIGADLSFVAQAESLGTVFRDGGVAKPALQIFREHGYSWIRLRLFHTVANSRQPLPNDLPYTIALAKRAKAMGYRFLLDFHYSDTWADPAHQEMPKAWAALPASALPNAVEQYTRDVIVALREAGVMPEMVQIGNEISVGMMWPAGKLPEQWEMLASLVSAGIRGVDAGVGTAARPLIMVHIDKGGNRENTQWFFDNLLQRHVAFDVIGQSYYPWWHGSLLALRENLAFMTERYRKPIIVVEAAYTWRPTEYLNAPAPFPESPEGQRDFLDAVHQAVLDTPHGLGRGVFWWEPAVAGGGLRARGMFDDAGNALPVINVFDRYTRGGPARR